jgi:hypothetical protein
VWSLPPATVLDALEELGTGRLKRHDLLLGIVLVPTVMQPDWFKHFVKVTDLYFFVPTGAIPKWPANMHEALTIGLYSPSSDINPGTGKTYLSWVDWEVRCQRCTAMTLEAYGIFCANFSRPVIGLPLCHRTWCAPWYHQRRGTDFLVYHRNDPDSVPNPSEEKITSTRVLPILFYVPSSVMNVHSIT